MSVLFTRRGPAPAYSGGGGSGEVSGTAASDLEIGTSVFLIEDGAKVEYLVVNQGKPSDSSLYDDSCNGTWLLRKDIHSTRVWDSSDNDYANSDIHTWLNDTFFATLGAAEQAAVQQSKIPYCPGNGTGSAINSGANGLAAKVFLLAYSEADPEEIDVFPADGAVLDYFSAGDYEKCIAQYNGTDTDYWLRSPVLDDYENCIFVSEFGSSSVTYGTTALGIRPALILDSSAKFDPDTMELIEAGSSSGGGDSGDSSTEMYTVTMQELGSAVVVIDGTSYTGSTAVSLELPEGTVIKVTAGAAGKNAAVQLNGTAVASGSASSDVVPSYDYILAANVTITQAGLGGIVVGITES